MTAYRHDRPAPEMTEDCLRYLQGVCENSEVASALEHAGVTRTDVHTFFIRAGLLLEAFGDSLEVEWNSCAGVCVCPRCTGRRWSAMSESHRVEGKKLLPRQCNDCGNIWQPMEFHREDMVQGRLRHYEGREQAAE